MIAIGLACNPKLHDRRRADHRARRDDPGADPEADEGPVARARHRAGGDHAQSRRGRALRRPRQRHVFRRASPSRARRAKFSAGHCIPTRRACCARCRGSTSRAAPSSRPSKACRPICSTRRSAAASRRAARPGSTHVQQARRRSSRSSAGTGRRACAGPRWPRSAPPAWACKAPIRVRPSRKLSLAASRCSRCTIYALTSKSAPASNCSSLPTPKCARWTDCRSKSAAAKRSASSANRAAARPRSAARCSGSRSRPRAR